MSKHSVAHYQRINGGRILPSRKKRSSKLRRGILRCLSILFFLCLLALVAGGAFLYLTPAGRVDRGTTYILVSPGAKYKDVEQQLQNKLWLRFPSAFRYLAQWKGLTSAPLRSGRYAIPRGATMPEVIEILQTAEQVPLTITPTALRTEDELITFLTSNLWLRADSLRTLLRDSSFMARYGATSETFRAEVLRQPFTIAWDAKGKTLLDSLHSGYLRFWKGARTDQAQRLGLTPLQVTTLASIVESESAKPDEYRRIAGLYLNRLRKDMRLQSDPTVKFALGDFALRRIKGEHLSVSSPYNTYVVTGLPPAPIVLPRTSTIDSVLRAEEHDYLYMCAREDFSGYHSFAADYATHLSNARRYQQELDKRGVN